MKRHVYIFVTLVVMMLVASVAGFELAKAGVNNHFDWAGNCPVEAGHWCHVDFGHDGAGTDVPSGPFSVPHDFPWIPGDIVTYTLTLTNLDTGEFLATTTFTIDDRPVAGDGQPQQISAPMPYQSWQCSVWFNQVGNRLNVGGSWMGEGHPYIMVDAGNGVIFGMLVQFDGTFADGTDYDVTKPGTYNVNTWIDGTNQGCGSTVVVIGNGAPVVQPQAQQPLANDQAAKPVQQDVSAQTGNNCTFVPHQAGDIISIHPRHCNWYAFTRNGELWFGHLDGGEWRVVGQSTQDVIHASDVSILPNGAIAFTAPDGNRYITDRVGSGPIRG